MRATEKSGSGRIQVPAWGGKRLDLILMMRLFVNCELWNQAVSLDFFR